MFLPLAPLCISFFCVVGVYAQCTPTRSWSNVVSQTDADVFNKCDTINGTISITLQNQTNLLSMDNIKHIIGSLELRPSTNGSLADMLTLSMKSLVSVGNGVRIIYGPTLSNLSLPSLATVGGELRLDTLPSLSSVNFRSLSTIGALALDRLPKLNTINFPAKLQRITSYQDSDTRVLTPGYFKIANTGLKNISGLAFPTAEIQLTSNPYLQDLTLPVESLTCYIYNTGTAITNNPFLNLDLPSLKILNCPNTTIDIHALSIPALTTINGSLNIRGDYGSLFSAPALVSILDTLLFGVGNLHNISLPALKTAQFIWVENNPAVLTENGLFMPNITNVTSLDISAGRGGQPYCRIFDNYRCRGLITGNYLCGGDVEVVRVAGDPGDCANTYPVSGWTSADKLRIGLAVSLGVTFALAVVVLGFWYNSRHRAARKMRERGVRGGEEGGKITGEDEQSLIVSTAERGKLVK